MEVKALYSLKSELEQLSKSVSDFIKSQLNQVASDNVEVKDLHSLVSYVDKHAEEKIVSKLHDLLPEAGFITEENTVAQVSKEYMWIIDPLDGTTNYLHKIPHFSISIALSHNEEVLLGIVYEVMLDNAYVAIKGEGAWENDRPLSVTATEDMINALVVTGFPYRRGMNIDKSLAVLKYCLMNCRGVRRLGSAALDLAYVASGKIDIYYENALNIWDVAAGGLLVKEAGGIMTDYKGEDNYHKRGSIIASNPHLYKFISEAIKENLT